MFLSPRIDSGDRSPFGDFWFSPVPFNGSNMNVTADMSLQLTAVYACVRYLSNAVSTLPFVLYEEAADGGKTKIKKHWLYRLFARRPNDFQDPMQFRSMMQGHLSLRGNAFARIYANNKGEVTDLIPIHPDRVTIEMLSDVNWRYKILNADGTKTPIARQDMFHLKGLSGNGIIGYNPIQLARKAIASGIAAQDYGLRFFENDAKPGGVITHPNQFKDDAQRKTWRDQFQEMQAGRNKHKTAVLEYGMTYQELKVSNDDAQFIETRKMSASDIAQMFGVRPHKIGILDKATFSNIEQQSIDSVNDDLNPWITCWEEAIRFNFMDPDDDTLHVEFPFISLLRGDSAARSLYYNKGIMGGWLTRNEARIAESYNPLPGLDEPLRPLNMIEEGAAEEEDEEVASGEALPANANPNDPPVNPGKSDARLVALASAAADRVARKEADMVCKANKLGDTALVDMYAKHAAFVSAALGISMEGAKAYCIEQITFAEKSADMDQHDFAEIARCKLERLAIKG